MQGQGGRGLVARAHRLELEQHPLRGRGHASRLRTRRQERVGGSRCLGRACLRRLLLALLPLLLLLEPLRLLLGQLGEALLLSELIGVVLLALLRQPGGLLLGLPALTRGGLLPAGPLLLGRRFSSLGIGVTSDLRLQRRLLDHLLATAIARPRARGPIGRH